MSETVNEIRPLRTFRVKYRKAENLDDELIKASYYNVDNRGYYRFFGNVHLLDCVREISNWDGRRIESITLVETEEQPRPPKPSSNALSAYDAGYQNGQKDLLNAMAEIVKGH